MGRRSTTGGVTALSQHRIQFDFTLDGTRYRPTLPWTPHEANLRRARERLARIKARIAASTFLFSKEFPDFRGRRTLPLPVSARTCGDVFDAFLRHEQARVARGDLAPVTLAAHRRILEHVWRPAIGAMGLLAVRLKQTHCSASRTTPAVSVPRQRQRLPGHRTCHRLLVGTSS